MAKELELKYGCNPNQKPAKIFMKEGELPVEVLNGRPGFINFLDAFNSWQLVKELKEATGMVCATSFKHVSPTSAAVGLPMSDALKKACFVKICIICVVFNYCLYNFFSCKFFFKKSTKTYTNFSIYCIAR